VLYSDPAAFAPLCGPGKALRWVEVVRPV
jgi:hypothetical protein